MRSRDRRIQMLEKKLGDKDIIMEQCVQELKDSYKNKMAEINGKVDELKRKNNKWELELCSQKILNKAFFYM